MRWIILIAVASLLVAAVASAVFEINRTAAAFTPPPVDLEKHIHPYADTFAVRLLERLGYRVKINLFPLQRDKFSIIIRSTGDSGDLDEWRPWLKGGRTLILFHRDAGEDARAIPAAFDHPLLRGVRSLALDPRLSLTASDFMRDAEKRETVLSRGGRPLIVRETVNDGEVIHIADENIFRDRNLLRGDNAVFLNNCLVRHYDGPIVFDYAGSAVRPEGRTVPPTEDSSGAAGPVFFLFRGNFLFVFLQFVWLGLVFLLVYWKRFGPVRDTEQFARRSLMRHLEAAGNFFEKTKNPLVIVDILDRSFIARLRELLRLSGGGKTDWRAEVGRRLGPGGREAGAADPFALHATKNLAARDDARELIIQRLKGVDKHHGQGKNAE